MQRRTRLVSTTPLVRRSPLRDWPALDRKPTRGDGMPRNRTRQDGPTDTTVLAVLARDGGRCVRCGDLLIGERGREWSIHHRRFKQKGGDRRPDTHRPQNLITVCGADNVTGCHGLIHQSKRAARHEGGWAVLSTEDPATVPVLVGGERWVYLGSVGGYVDNPPEVAA